MERLQVHVAVFHQCGHANTMPIIGPARRRQHHDIDGRRVRPV